MKKINLFITGLFILIGSFGYAQGLPDKINSAEKFNERGFLNNTDCFMDGKEIIGEYDGNLMLHYESPLDLPNEMSTIFTIVYNTNVGHRVFDDIGAISGFPINAPEWILGIKGFAVQTFNFENNFYLGHQAQVPPIPLSSGTLSGQEAPLLIPGYHYSNMLTVANFYDVIQIMKADGSLMYLENVATSMRTGLYIDKSKEQYGFAKVEWLSQGQELRKMYYKSTDGFTFYFEEAKVEFYDRPAASSGNSPACFYLKEIYAPGQAPGVPSLKLYYQNLYTNNYGRKNFTNVTSFYKYGSSNPTELGLAIYAGSYFYHAELINYNTNKNYTIKFIPSANPNFPQIRDKSYSNILNVEKITDNLGLEDNFIYYSRNNTNYVRDYALITGGTQEFIIEHKMSLLNKIITKTKKESEFEYQAQLYNSSNPNLMLNYFWDEQFISSNYDAQFRDCFTNYMIKKRKVYDYYDGVKTLVTDEDYIYSVNRINNPGDNKKSGIITKIISNNHLSDNNPSTKRTLTYKQFVTNSWNYNALDFRETVKLVSEITEDLDETGERIEKTYNYDYGIYNTSTPFHYWDGTFNMFSETVKKYNVDNQYVETKDSLSYLYEEIVFSPQLGDTKKIKKQTTKLDALQSLTSITENKNFVPITGNSPFNINTALINSTNASTFIYSWLYKLELPSRRKNTSGSLIKDDIKYNYYDVTTPSMGKLFEEVQWPDNNPVTKRYSYHSWGADVYYAGNLSREEYINNDLKLEYTYPGVVYTNGYFTPYQEVSGKVVKYNGSSYDRSLIHSGFQNKPIKTTHKTLSGTELFSTYASYNSLGKLQFEVDLNGNISEYFYDNIGRIKQINLPGSFSSDVSSFDTRVFRGSNSFTRQELSTNGIPYFVNYFTAGSTRSLSQSKLRYSVDEFDYVSEDVYSFIDRPLNLMGTSYTITEIEKSCLIIKIKRNSYAPSDNPVNYITVGGIDVPFTELQAYSVTGNVVTTSNLPSSINSDYVQIAVDISPILDYFKLNNKTLYGFKIICYYGSGSSYPYMNEYLVDSQPIMRIGGLNSSAPSGNYEVMPDQVFSNGSISFTYDDQNNTVTEEKRFIADPNNTLSKKSTYKLDAFRNIRETLVKNDAGVDELKGKTSYNFFRIESDIYDAENRKTTKEYDYLTRPVKIKFTNNTNKPTKYIDYYIAPSNTDYAEYTKTKDENATSPTPVEEYSYYDKVGNLKKKEVKDQGSTLTTTFTYNPIYQLTQVTSPGGKPTTYAYDLKGNISQRTTRDDGTYKYKYDKFSNLRFMINTSNSVYLMFNKYDRYNRLILSGIHTFTNSFDYLNGDIDYSTNQSTPYTITHFENNATDTSKFVVVNMYDSYTATGVFYNINPPSFSFVATNLKGKLVATAFRDKPGQQWNYKAYSYDYLGNVKYYWIKYGNMSWVRIYNSYDHSGNLTLRQVYSYQSVNSNFYYFYTYDLQGRLKDVKTNNINSLGTASYDANITYRTSDLVNTVSYNSLIFHIGRSVSNYDDRARLTQIYSQTRYDDGEVVRPWETQFQEDIAYNPNSNISSITILNKGNTSWPNLTFNYSYLLNRLASANCVNDVNKSETYTYNNDGNLLTKSRYGNNYTYSYESSNYNNRIDYITYNGASKDFTFDSKGNLTKDNLALTDQFEYDRRNLILKVRKDASYKYYRYDDAGQRIYKQTSTTKEFYLRDHMGRELAIYDLNNSDRVKTFNIYANDLLGRADVNFVDEQYFDPEENEWVTVTNRYDDKYYYIKDHLGSIRLTIDKNATCVNAFDYYPYGEELRSYYLGGNTQRYKFTEKERDVETNYDYFPPGRTYDSELGRWLQVDPLFEKYPNVSPYNYALNNPLRFIDPKGMEAVDATPDDPDDPEKRKDNTKSKKQLFSYNTSVDFAVGGGFNIETGATFDPNTGDLFLFWKWGMSLGLSASAGIEGSVQYLDDIEEAKGSKSDINPQKNTIEVDFPSGISTGILGVGGNMVFESPNNYRLIGGGSNLSIGTGVSLNSTYATYSTPTINIYKFLNKISKIGSTFKWQRK